MLLTFKIKHERDFTAELAKARKVADFALTSDSYSSATVKHIGLKSAIACQILKKYVRNKNIKAIHNVMLTIPGQQVKLQGTELYVPCLKLRLNISHMPKFDKVNQIECGKEYACVTVTVPETPMTEQDQNAACCKIYPKAQAWILEDVLPLKIRFDVKGQLGVFTVDDELIEERTTAAIARSVGQEEMVKNIAKRWALHEANISQEEN